MDARIAMERPSPGQDRLLRTTLAILRLAQFLTAAAIGLLVIFTAALWLFPALATHFFEKASVSYTLVSFSAEALAALFAGVMTFIVFDHLVKVVRTVDEGNAFTTENAVRLRKIAYLSLGILVAEFVLAAIGYFYHESTRDGIHWFDWDPSSIITILVLFVMARVFEEGVRLNDEAQLTV
jgi:Protein of unknown function (DUF2975)